MFTPGSTISLWLIHNETLSFVIILDVEPWFQFGLPLSMIGMQMNQLYSDEASTTTIVRYEWRINNAFCDVMIMALSLLTGCSSQSQERQTRDTQFVFVALHVSSWIIFKSHWPIEAQCMLAKPTPAHPIVLCMFIICLTFMDLSEILI